MHSRGSDRNSTEELDEVILENHTRRITVHSNSSLRVLDFDEQEGAGSQGDLRSQCVSSDKEKSPSINRDASYSKSQLRDSNYCVDGYTPQFDKDAIAVHPPPAGCTKSQGNCSHYSSMQKRITKYQICGQHEARSLEEASSQLQNDRCSSIVQDDIDSPYQAFCSVSNEVTGRSVSEFARFMSDDISSGFIVTSDVLSDEELISEIIIEMKENPSEESIQIKGLRSLRNLLTDEDRRSAVGQFGGIDAVVSAMRNFPSQKAVQKQALCFIADVCQSNLFNKYQASQNGAIETILKYLQSTPIVTSNIQELELLALWACCHGCQTNQELAISSGAVQVILLTMRSAATGPSLQEKCFRVLLTLVADNAGNIDSFHELGGTAEILASIRKYPDDLRVQIAALQLSRVLLQDSNRIRDSMECGGLLEDMEESLATFNNNRFFLTACCSCIRFLSFIPRFRDSISETSIIPILLTVLQAQADDEEVIVGALLALGNIAFDSMRSKHRIVSEEGIPILLHLLRRHKGRRIVTEQACRLIRNVADGKRRTKQLCAHYKPLPVVIQAMKEQPAASAVQEHGAATLLNLACIEGAELRDAKLEEHIELVLPLHAAIPTAYRQLSHLRDLIRQLTSRSSSVLAKLIGRPSTSGDSGQCKRSKKGSSRQKESTNSELSSSRERAHIPAEEVLDEELLFSSIRKLSRATEY